MEILKVSASSSPNSVAGAIATIVKKGASLEIQAVGAAAVNQAIKSIAVARGFLAPSGKELAIVPCFANINIESRRRTAIRLIVKVSG